MSWLNQQMKHASKGLAKIQQSMLNEWNLFKVQNGILIRKRRTLDNTLSYQRVLPFKCKSMFGLHNQVRHPGTETSLFLLQERFFWPGMSKHIKEWMQGCKRCVSWVHGCWRSDTVSSQFKYNKHLHLCRRTHLRI